MAIVIMVGYIYSLTFKPEGRLDWGQALFLKLAGDNEKQIASLSNMTIKQRSHFLDAVPYSIEGLDIDTLKITIDSLLFLS